MANPNKSMVELDGDAKILLNEIKSQLLKQNSKETKLTTKTSYRSIVKTAIEEYHKKMIVQ